MSAQPFPKDLPILANPDIVFRQEDDGAFLFDPNTGDLKCLNSVASIIWTLLNGTRSFENLLATLVAKYPDVSQSQLEQDLSHFLSPLFAAQYVGTQTP